MSRAAGICRVMGMKMYLRGNGRVDAECMSTSRMEDISGILSNGEWRILQRSSSRKSTRHGEISRAPGNWDGSLTRAGRTSLRQAMSVINGTLGVQLHTVSEI